MNFSSNENYKLLYEIVTENITNDLDIFNKVFNDFSNLNQNNTENYDLITYNKQFLTLLQSVIHNKPEVASQKRKVTFDNKLEEHKQHFLSYMPKTPPTPDFLDKTDNTNLDHIDTLIQQTLLKRNYEPITTPNTRKPRKIQIQAHPIDQDTLTKDAIILDNTTSSSSSSVKDKDTDITDPLANLFSKLQNKINDNVSQITIPTQTPIPINTKQTDDIHTCINTIQTNINNILETFEKLKLLL